MSLSFEDSLKKNIAATAAMKQENIVQENIVAPASMNIDNMSIGIGDMGVDDYSVMTLDESLGIAAYSGDDGNWQQHNDYVYYYYFSDDDISTVGEQKDIILNRKQFNITQEENSQYIPFEMSRYYDGFDLVNTIISIHYETSGKYHGATKPVNVTFNDEKIRFGWLVDAGATLDVGTLKFEIHAYGTVTGSDGIPKSYVWKSKSNSDLVVLQSICDCKDVVNNIDDSWIQELITNVAEKVADEIKDVAVGEQVKAAEDAALIAEQHAAAAEQYANNASSAATDAVNAVIENYATKTYVDDAVASVDVSGQLENYVQTSDLEENYYTKTQTEQRVNDILENYATKEDVSTAITEADITSKLENYYTKEESYSKGEVDEKLGNVKVDLTGYATETYVDNKTEALSSSISANASGISGINSAISTINQTLESIDKSPRITYDATYGDVELDDGSTTEYMFTLWKTENGVREVQDRFQIAGGDGGGAGGVVLRIAYVDGYTTPLVSTVDERVIVKYNFSGEDPAGDINLDGVASWKVGNRIVATEDVATGECEFDLTEYVTVGDNKVVLTITHATGAVATKAWTVKVVDVRLESTFDDTKVNAANEFFIRWKRNWNKNKCCCCGRFVRFFYNSYTSTRNTLV